MARNVYATLPRKALGAAPRCRRTQRWKSAASTNPSSATTVSNERFQNSVKRRPQNRSHPATSRRRAGDGTFPAAPPLSRIRTAVSARSRSRPPSHHVRERRGTWVPRLKKAD